jgi:hypothetical protein
MRGNERIAELITEPEEALYLTEHLISDKSYQEITTY